MDNQFLSRNNNCSVPSITLHDGQKMKSSLPGSNRD